MCPASSSSESPRSRPSRITALTAWKTSLNRPASVSGVSPASRGGSSSSAAVTRSRMALREPPGDDAAERVPDDDRRARRDRAQDGRDVGAVTRDQVGAGRVVGAPVAAKVDPDDPPAARELVREPFPGAAARADTVQEQHRRRVVGPVELDVEADAVALDAPRLGHERRTYRSRLIPRARRGRARRPRRAGTAALPRRASRVAPADRTKRPCGTSARPRAPARPERTEVRASGREDR